MSEVFGDEELKCEMRVEERFGWRIERGRKHAQNICLDAIIFLADKKSS